jgi:integral membrane protein (TIGR01906 family)
MKTVLKYLSRITIIIILPVLLILTALRLVLTPAYLNIEYRMPGFPEDVYGFTLEDRLFYSERTYEYLVNSEDISFLENLHFKDGTGIYNERELSHMEDVQVLIALALRVWSGLLITILILVLLLIIFREYDELKVSFFWAGWVSVGLVVILLLLILLDFDKLFTQFHKLLAFPGDTWLFYSSDTLIRLLPIRFFTDTFIFVGLFTLVIGLGLGLGLRRKSNLNK